MKIIKPDNLSLLYRTLRFERRDLLSIGLLAMFDFDAPRADALHTESYMWEAVAQALGTDGLLDAGFPKPNGEWLAYGAAYAPNGVAAPVVATQVQIGDSKKTLNVHGERRFGSLGGVTSGMPFVRMPIDAVHAFGHPALGVESERRPPNVESPDAPILERADLRAAAGYWPLQDSAGDRARMLGALDAKWLQQDWPHLPLGTHVDYFMNAPVDQRIGGFWHGKERIEIRHMHPTLPVLQGNLPGIRARCFVRRQAGETTRFEECLARQETVWLFPELCQGIVLFRAVAAIDDEDADDVTHVVAGWEAIDSTPVPMAFYQQQLVDAEMPRSPVGSASTASAPDETVVETGAPMATASAAAAAAPAAAAAEAMDFGEIDRLSADLKSQTDALMKQHGLGEKDLEPYMTSESLLPSSSANAARDLEQMVQDLQKSTDDMLRQMNLSPEDLRKVTAEIEAREAEVPDLGMLGQQLRDLHMQTQSALAATGKTPEELAAHIGNPELANAVRQSADFDFESLIASLQTLASLTPAAAAAAGVAQDTATLASPAVSPPSTVSASPSVAPRLTREEVIERVAAGQSLAGFDLTALDLSKAALEGADFSGALLTDARFTGSRLSGANLAGAQIAGADFSGTIMRGASLSGASGRGAIFDMADLENTTLDSADFADSDFNTAVLTNVDCRKAIFSGSRMMGVRAANCAAAGASFEGCDLTGADFRQAVLVETVFDGATLIDADLSGANAENLRLFGTKAAGARFDEAQLSGSRAGLAADFTDASFNGARLAAATWLDVNLSRAAFETAQLERANFSGVTATGARFAGAQAKSMQLAKADLTGADLSRANLMNATLRRARLDGAVLRQANLYGAQCYGSTIGKADLEGANIDRTLAAIPGRPELES
ncbi:DUF2169 family type VI secretion system accessory protein [Chitinasiproducens palmae]|uniref:Uncharacterized protein YjbI, contains pentapeptide repeats n=1 Tax=Chitinasiproducens palmae TaxID=1770053 RepID=A0A1H2PL36_9BURK|nr:pentapeptide repeat-containing protein [Chitinasiproducens palmae]SDV47147.1 Uncharacterized protein YjbI, contains pentapeptide repeats [Chitinasiproducens palmae]